MRRCSDLSEHLVSREVLHGANPVGRSWSVRQQDRESSERTSFRDIALTKVFGGADGI